MVPAHMMTAQTTSPSIASLLLPVALNAQTASLGALASRFAAQKSPRAPSASMAVKESFDNNMFVQDHGDQVKREDWTERQWRWC